MGLGLDLAMIGLFVASFFMSVLFYPVYWMAFGMTVALAEGTRRSSASVPRPQTKSVRRRPSRWAEPSEPVLTR
jgi:hypothetical protein